MQFEPKLSGDAAALAREHSGVLRRLPGTVHAFILIQLQKWPLLFPAEQRYQRGLLSELAALTVPALATAVEPIARIESDAGVRSLGESDPVRFQDEAQARLRRQRRLQDWRTEVDRFFRQVDPAIDARLHPPDAPRRLVVQIYSSGIAVRTERLWDRFKGSGVRVPLTLGNARATEGFLAALFGGADGGAARPLGSNATDGLDPRDVWIVESHEALHVLWGGAAAPADGGRLAAPPSALPTGLSFDRLRQYRDELTRALYEKIRTGVESPQAFAAYARALRITPGPGALLWSDPVLEAFVRDLFLTGNGTLFVNNTFAEWASVETIRRAQPRVLVTRFGVRDKLKPFSSLLLFSQPRASDQIPFIEDPLGSFIDVEQLSYYVWLNAEKSAAYRGRTLYLFLAEGVEEMLALRSDTPLVSRGTPPAATLGDVHATMAQWLGVSVPGSSGRPIGSVVS